MTTLTDKQIKLLKSIDGLSDRDRAGVRGLLLSDYDARILSRSGFIRVWDPDPKSPSPLSQTCTEMRDSAQVAEAVSNGNIAPVEAPKKQRRKGARA